jgi:hypothetical protein
LNPEARAGSRNSDISLQVVLVIGKGVSLAGGGTVAVAGSVGAGLVAVTPDIVIAAGVAVEEMVHANIVKDNNESRYMIRFIKSSPNSV